MSRYRKRPIEIEAYKWVRGREQADAPEWIMDALRAGKIEIKNAGERDMHMRVLDDGHTMVAREGDWIARGIKGELYPISDEIFVASYEAV